LKFELSINQTFALRLALPELTPEKSAIAGNGYFHCLTLFAWSRRDHVG